MASILIKPVIIPAKILALRKAKLPEKLLLATYAADPATKRVRRAMSMTRADLRKIEQRLIEKELLTVLGGRHMVRMAATLFREIRPRRRGIKWRITVRSSCANRSR